MGAGALFARGRQGRIGGLGQLVGLGQHGLGLLARVGRFVARGLGGRNRIHQHIALFGDLLRNGFRSRKFDAKFFLTARQFRRLALGIGLAGVPAGLFFFNRLQAAQARFAFAAQAFQRTTRFAGLGAGFGRLAAGI